MPYAVALDVEHDQAHRLYHVKAIPHTVLIDRDGEVLKTWQGWSGSDGEAEIRETIVKLIADQ
jgi:peroxiredoxin